MNVTNYPSAEDLAHGLEKAKKVSTGWQACCPAHDDKRPSLSINENPIPNAGPLVHCHTGCEQPDVIEALRSRGLWPERNANGASANLPGNKKTTYKYHHANGDVAYEIHRLDFPGGGKAFWQTHNGLKEAYPAPRPIYNLPAIVRRKDAPDLIAEGEKAAIRGRRYSLIMLLLLHPAGASQPKAQTGHH